MWRSLNADNTAILQLDEGPVVIELNPTFAPKTIAQFKRLSREGFYDGQSFYRVIDGFVAQGGDGSDMGVANAEPTIKAETVKLSFSIINRHQYWMFVRFQTGAGCGNKPRDWVTTVCQ